MAAFTGKNKEHYFQTDLATVQANDSQSGSIEHLQGFHRNCGINKYVQSLKYHKKNFKHLCVEEELRADWNSTFVQKE